MPINWDLDSLIRKKAGIPILVVNLNLLTVIKLDPSAGVAKYEFRSFLALVISSTKDDVVSSARATKLPRSLEQLKEFADDYMVHWVGNYTYHCSKGLT